MADKQKYFIRLHGKKIEVSEDVYYAVPMVRTHSCAESSRCGLIPYIMRF